MSKDLLIASFGGAMLGSIVANLISHACSGNKRCITHDGELEPVNQIRVIRPENSTNPFTGCLDKIADKIVEETNSTMITPTPAIEAGGKLEL